MLLNWLRSGFLLVDLQGWFVGLSPVFLGWVDTSDALCNRMIVTAWMTDLSSLESILNRLRSCVVLWLTGPT
jgi:hypothetical protein